MSTDQKGRALTRRFPEEGAPVTDGPPPVIHSKLVECHRSNCHAVLDELSRSRRCDTIPTALGCEVILGRR